MIADVICYIVLPIKWLFFAASSYVWIQYVWQTERGICLGTIVLWVLFVWLEASVRLREIKTIDLCRPFAAHCIGYPMVTLGFGFKTYLVYKWRLRKQRDVRKINEAYVQLIDQALPVEIQQETRDKGSFTESCDDADCTEAKTTSKLSNGTDDEAKKKTAALVKNSTRRTKKQETRDSSLGFSEYRNICNFLFSNH